MAWVDLINVQLCISPYTKKNETEKQVKNMLVLGIIQPSSSSYSSKVILIKKKDGNWNFCIDYRALNKVIVPNKFSIPICWRSHID